MTSFVNYTDIDVNKIGNNPPENKTVRDQPGTNYGQVVLNYDYGTGSQSIIESFYLQMPLVSSTGIISKLAPKSTTKMEHSMFIPLPSLDKDVVNFVNVFNNIHNRTKSILLANKMPLKLYDLDQHTVSAVFKNPIYYPRDKTTGELIQGRSPSFFVKLFKRGSGPTEEKTLFTDLQGEPIDWEILRNVDMKFIPLLHFDKIYIGSKPSLQFKIVSAIVVEVTPKNSMTRQSSTIEEYKAKNPGSELKLAEQIHKLTMDRQDLLNLPSDSTQLVQQTAQMQPINKPATPTSPVTVQSSTQDFLANAPPRNMMPPSENNDGSAQVRKLAPITLPPGFSLGAIPK